MLIILEAASGRTLALPQAQLSCGRQFGHAGMQALHAAARAASAPAPRDIRRACG
jgi:hypothetical protein